ncbi:16S rRNA (cytosine(1402)-N(4))-methyltransferase RsmH [Candidatus Uhrbacteria bacterium]|jgi:16S rRNA (cytosine1402-N4)-methyltransferase|nr:16S rRNA (cytosine(1402)-N(4))-methyltransferase RsmH [Candidatus Uhrbacteria bacterium]
MAEHIPVLAGEVIEGLNIKPGMRVLDATVGLGGHARLLLAANAPDGELIAFDRDVRNLDLAQRNLKSDAKRIKFIHDSYANLGEYELDSIDAAVYDLGYSSVHVDDATRGFSFQKDGPLDMRYDTRQEMTADGVINSWTKDELAALFRQLGEEPMAAQIADAITKQRKRERFERTTQLADFIAQTVRRRGRMHPATRVFQALRIVVNDEFGELVRGLDAIEEALVPGGRLAVLTFHSLEDRIVKRFIKGSAYLDPINKHVIRASHDEVLQNPRARSAKLRIAERNLEEYDESHHKTEESN